MKKIFWFLKQEIPSPFTRTPFKEYKNQQNKPVRKHVDRYTMKSLQISDIEILASTNQYIGHLLTLKALYIREIDCEINTEDEYCSRELTTKF